LDDFFGEGHSLKGSVPSEGTIWREPKFACIAAMVSALCAKCFWCQTLGPVLGSYWLLRGFVGGGNDISKVAALDGTTRDATTPAIDREPHTPVLIVLT
jgi:hypothetical protein